MNSALTQDFTERSKEVSKYFIFLKSLEQGTTKLSMDGKGDSSKIKVIDPELLKTLKASGFLLLYNLVEATMRSLTTKSDLSLRKLSSEILKSEILTKFF
jgi:hypothetical protein